MHEIVTLQFGKQSNHIGTHFWNAQESYFTYSANEESLVDHDVHFRPGIGADGSETFTPRTVIYDVKDNFGTLRQVNALYEIREQADAPPGAWGNNPIIRQQPSIQPHQYQAALDAGTTPQPIAASTVRFWSDFNRVFYHPRSMVQLNFPISHLTSSGNTQVEPLDQWSVGDELFKTEDQEHDLLDRDLRLFVEESDQLQGFQVLTGADDAWAGFAGRYVERLKDEYGRKSIWVWGTEEYLDSPSREKKIHQAVNVAKSSSIFSEQATLYMPLSSRSPPPVPSYLNQGATKWETSALQAAAIESVTLPTRLSTRGDAVRGFMSDLEPVFTDEVERNVLKLSFSASKPQDEAPLTNGHATQDHRMVNGVDHDEDESAEPEELDIELFTSNFVQTSSRHRIGQRNDHVFSQATIMRGFEAPDPTSPGRPLPYAPVVQTYTSSLLAPRPSSFPSILSFQGVDAHASIAAKAALTASTAVADRMRSLAEIVQRSVGIVDDREELRADLLAKAEEYVDGYEEDASSDDE